MSLPPEAPKTQRVWELLTRAGLVEIDLHEFPKKIKEVKHVTMGRLSELLELASGIQEQQSIARSLGFLKNLESTVQDDVGLNTSDPSRPPDK